MSYRANPPRHAFRPELQNPVVTGANAASSVTVARGEPQRTVGCGHHRAQAPVLPDEQRRRGADGPVARHRDLEQPLPAQGRHPQRSAVERQTRRRGLTGAPLDHRVDHALDTGAALRFGPPVVGAGTDQVQLVDPVGAILGGPQPSRGVPRQSLDVAVPVGPHRRSGKRVVRWHGTIRVDAKDLARQRCSVLRKRWIRDLAGRDVELAVGAERNASAVVTRPGGDAGENRCRVGERAVGETHLHDAVVAARGEVGVNVSPCRRQAEQTTFAARRDAGHRTDLLDDAGRGEVFDCGTVSFGDQRAAVGQKCDAPGHVQVGGDGRRPARGFTTGFDVLRAGDHEQQARGDRQHGPRQAAPHRSLVTHAAPQPDRSSEPVPRLGAPAR